MTYLIVAAITIIFIALFIAALRLWMIRLVENKISNYQSSLMSIHYDEVENIYKQMRGWRHDYHNHIQTMKAYITLNQLAELEKYLGKLDSDLSTIDTVLKTGNIMVDAILNSKLSFIKSKNIPINAKATVPSMIKTSEIDLCIIIGNLLDNAMEACLKISEKDSRFIRVYIGSLKGHLYISITNSMAGKVKKFGINYISTKNDSHGFGLMRVDSTVNKYKGYINRQNEDGVFATEIMLPM